MGTQLAITLDALQTANVRQLASVGSLSGALIGGLLFGAGMILTRGCASRMLILAGTGNPRSLLSGLLFAVTAPAASGSILTPLREWLNLLWTIPGGDARDLLAILGWGRPTAIAIAGLWLVAGVVWAVRSQIPRTQILHAIGVGLTIVVAWIATYQLSPVAFDPVPVRSLTFTTPSANVLMTILATPSVPFDFDFFFISRRYSPVLSWLPGATANSSCRGFRGTRDETLPGRCRPDGFWRNPGWRLYRRTGVTGASLFSLTSWLTLLAMWVGGIVTHRLVDHGH
jgi:hypothetical protein